MSSDAGQLQVVMGPERLLERYARCPRQRAKPNNGVGFAEGGQRRYCGSSVTGLNRYTVLHHLGSFVPQELG